MALAVDLMGLGTAPGLATLMGQSVATVVGTGTAQVGAAALTGTINLITTATNQTAVALSSDQPIGKEVQVYVPVTPSALVFPPSGGNINEVAANGSFTVAAARTATFLRVSATKWVVNYGS